MFRFYEHNNTISTTRLTMPPVVLYHAFSPRPAIP